MNARYSRHASTLAILSRGSGTCYGPACTYIKKGKTFLKSMNVIFLTQTPFEGPASRYRVYQYIDFLQSQGVNCTVVPAISTNLFKKLYYSDNFMDKFCYFSVSLLNRFKDLFKIKNYDIVFMQREIIPYLFPPVLEKIIARLNGRLVFDFDDAIFLPPKKQGLLYKLTSSQNKVSEIIKVSQYVVTGNNFLKEYALTYNKNVEVIPTSIDTERYSLKQKKDVSDKVTIGWIGTPSNLSYLYSLTNVLQNLSRRYKIVVKIIGGKGARIESVDIISCKWRYETEVEDIQSFDIGIMPLLNNEWSKGKCGTKILQYLSVGVPVVCSPVGVNKEIIKDGINGFLANSDEEWVEKLSRLIKDEKLRHRFRENGRRIVEEQYSINANAPKLKSVLEKVY